MECVGQNFVPRQQPQKCDEKIGLYMTTVHEQSQYYTTLVPNNIVEIYNIVDHATLEITDVTVIKIACRKLFSTAKSAKVNNNWESYIESLRILRNYLRRIQRSGKVSDVAELDKILPPTTYTVS